MVDPKQKAFDETLVNLFSNPEIAAGNLYPAVRSIAETCAQVMDMDRVTVWRPTAIETEYQCIEAFDRGQKTHSSGDILLINQYPNFFNAILNERLIRIPDITADPRVTGIENDYLKHHRITALLCVPLWIRGRLSGFISFEKEKLKDRWSQAQETFACQIGDLVVQTIYSAQNQELKRQVQQYEATLENLTQGSDPDIALHDLIHYASHLIDSDCGLVFLTDARARQCCCTISYNAPMSYADAVLAYGEDAAGIVAETGRAVVLQNYQGWQARSSQFEPDGYSAVIAVPIKLRTRVAGVVQMMRQGADREFVDWDQKMLEMLAKQFAVILDQVHQRDRRKREEGHRQAIHRLVDIAAQSSDLSATFDSALNLILDSMGLDKGSVHTTPLVTGRGLSSEEETQIYQGLDRDGHGFSIPISVDAWEHYSGALTEIAPLMKRLEIRASMFVPILVDSSYLGSICLHSPTPRGWTENTIRQVQAMARVIAIAADKLTSHQYLEIHTRLMNKLNSVNRGLNRLFSFDEAVNLVGQAAVNLLEADQAAIFLRNPDGSFECRWSNGLPAAQIERSAKTEGEDLARMLMGFTTPLTVPEIKPSRLPAQFKKMLTSEGVQCMIALPLIFSGQVIGTIACFFRRARELSALERSVIEAFTSQAAIAMQNSWMHEQMEQGYTDVALALARAMDARDSSISDSSLQIAEWAEETGRRLGLSEKEIKDLHWAALLHNIGKVSVPDEVLHKPGTLNAAEWRVVQQYPVKGEELIHPLTRFHDVGQIIRNAREHYDGSGYPDQRKGEEIPLAARILGVADAFTSMLDNRPYRKARNPQEAIVELEQASGKQFDPKVVSAFVEAVKTEKGGNGRHAPHHN
ncbi:MAG TPA: GAF domain-containing protein [Anaerolineaceae bacterium]